MTHRRQVKRNGKPCSEGDVATSMVPFRDELEGPELLTTHSRGEEVRGHPGEVRKRMEKTEPWGKDGGENPKLRPSGYRRALSHAPGQRGERARGQAEECGLYSTLGGNLLIYSLAFHLVGTQLPLVRSL